MATLPDTSVWIEFLRTGREGVAARLDDLLDAGLAITCGPVAAELAAGLADDDRGVFWGRLTGLPWVSLDRDGWRRVAEVKRQLDRSGGSVALTDLEIAVAGAREGAEVWSLDSDFDRIATVMPDLRLAGR